MRSLIVLVLVIGGFLSCQSQKDTLNFSEEFLIQIANDPIYRAYQETIHKDAERIVLGEYDMDGIGEIFDALPYGTNICLSENAGTQFSKLRGGDLYLANECQRQEYIRKLDDKFGYSGFPEEITLDLVKIYQKLNRRQLEERANNLYHKKN